MAIRDKEIIKHKANTSYVALMLEINCDFDDFVYFCNIFVQPSKPPYAMIFGEHVCPKLKS